MNKDLVATSRENNSETACWILGFNQESKAKVKESIMKNGMKAFLLQHKEMDLSEYEHDKIEVLKRVMMKYDGDVEAINFGDVEDFY